jgi:hypothetical protein
MTTAGKALNGQLPLTDPATMTDVQDSIEAVNKTKEKLTHA